MIRLRRRRAVLALAGLLATLACPPAAVHARAQTTLISGIVVKVRDGDTVQMLTDSGQRIEVRLNAIDAPEKAGGTSRGQPHAERARIHLAQLVLRRRATLHRTTMDRYGRHVGMLAIDTSEGKVDAGWWQLRSGFAWVYLRYLEEIPLRLRSTYRDAEAHARAQRLGLWSDARPVPPWEWRRRQTVR
jgi:endonuclease YncB( thermonuclease family)